MALADLTALLDDLVRDPDDHIADEQRARALQLAVGRYSQDRPRPLIAAATAPGTALIDLPAPWTADIARLGGVARVLSGGDEEALRATVELTLAGERIRLCPVPAAGADLVIRWHDAHVLDEETDTIPPAHREALAAWAGALLLDQLAGVYAGAVSPTIPSDSADWQTKSNDYARRARDLRRRYQEGIGVDPSRTAPAYAVVDLDRPDSRGRDRLLHPGRRR